MELERAIEIINDKQVTAYELHKSLGLNEAGVRRVLNGEVTRPQRKTKEALIQFALSLKNTIETDTKELFFKKDDISVSIDDIAMFVAENEDEFMKKKVFSNIIEVRVAKKIAEITTSKDKLLEYLKS